MKTTNQLLFLLAIVGLMSCKNQLHVVTLYVNTEDIQKGKEEESANFDQPVGIENKNFITNVRKGERIIWQGQSISNAKDIVKITSIEIKPEEGEEIFKLKPFKSIKVNGDPVGIEGSDELIRAKVTSGPGRDEAYIIQEYTIEFTVFNEGVKRNGTFKIDPVMKAY